MKNMATLVIIQLLTILSCIQLQEGSDGNWCHELDKDGDCICCKSGYRGKTCTAICPHCLSRYIQGQLCKYYCTTGYYGKTCEKSCPKTCDDGITGPRFCEERNGLPRCAACVPGYYGTECGTLCGKHCLDHKCHQISGKCLNCRRKTHHGNHCDVKCNSRCASGTCNRTGHCNEGCKYGFFGDTCESKCGENCMNGKCMEHEYHLYKCTEGCISGYKGIQCSEKCQHHCMKCEQQSGDCTSCVDDYVINPETKECMEKDSSVTIAVSLCVGFIVVVGITVILIVWKRKCKRQERDHDFDDRDANGAALVTHINEQEDTNRARTITWQGC